MTRNIGRRPRRSRVPPLALLRVPDSHLRLRCRAVFQPHEFNLPRDFLLLLLAFRLRERRGARGGHLALIEVPQRHRVSRRVRRENLVGHPRVRLEEHEPAPERRHVRQSHRLCLPPVFACPAKRRDVPHALGHVPRVHRDVKLVRRSSEMTRLDPGVEAVRALQALTVAVDEPGRRRLPRAGEAPEHPELPAVALLPLRVEVQQRGQQPAVAVRVVHVSHVPRVVARVDGAHRLGPGRYRRELGPRLRAEFVDQRVRSFHRGG